MKLLNIDYDIVLPTLEAQMKIRKAEKAAEKAEDPDGAPVKPEKASLAREKPSRAPLVQGILDEREVRDKRNKDKFEKNGALKQPKRDDKNKKNNKLDRQPENKPSQG